MDQPTWKPLAEPAFHLGLPLDLVKSQLQEQSLPHHVVLLQSWALQFLQTLP